MKNKIKLILAASLLSVGVASAQTGGVGVGTTTPDASSALDVTSTTKGFLMPRMTTVQRTAIATPANGLQVYDTTTNSQWYYNGTVWVQGASKADGSKFTNDATNTRVALTNLSDGVTARPAGKEFVITDAGKIGIGTAAPTATLDIRNDGSTSVDIKAVSSNTSFSRLFFHDGTGDLGAVQAIGSSSALVSRRKNLELFAKSNMTFWTNNDQRMILDITGNLGIGTTTPTSKLQVVGLPVHVDNAAAVTAGLTAGAFYHSGDGIVRVVY